MEKAKLKIEFVKQIIDNFVKAVNEDTSKTPVIVEKSYNDDYFDKDDAQKYLDKVKKNEEVYDDMLEYNVEYITESENLIIEEAVQDNSELLVSIIPDIGEYTGKGVISKLLNFTELYDGLEDMIEFELPSSEIKIESWFGEYNVLYTVGTAEFNDIVSSVGGLIINIDFIKWLNLLGFSFAEYLDEAIKRNEDDKYLILTTNEVKSIEELKDKYKDGEVQGKKSCTLDKIFSVILNCSITEGNFQLGGKIDGDTFKLFMEDKEVKIKIEGIAIWSFWEGGGYAVSVDGSGNSVIPLKDCYIDRGDYGISSAYGEDVW